MDMDVTDLGNNTVKIALHGRLDTPGVDQIELRFSATIVPKGKNAIVDLSDVSFVASMGLRMFISVARSVAGKIQQRFCAAASVGRHEAIPGLKGRLRPSNCPDSLAYGRRKLVPGYRRRTRR